MKPQPTTAKDYSGIEIVRLVWLAIFVSVFSFLIYNRRGDVLLYGDAVAHINIARRVFDSKTPGLLQLGTVWLPLPHLLILPFIVSKQMWQSGTGGSIPSMAAYVLGVLGIFRLVRELVRELLRELVRKDPARKPSESAARVCAWSAAILYGANPNLIYLQATAMGEALYLACFIWSIVFFVEFVRREPTPDRSLIKCGLCLVAACFTRYDGWFLAAVLVVSASAFLIFTKKTTNAPTGTLLPASRMAVAKFVLLAATAPALWLAYNAAVYRNPLEFANGPYSAKAIEQKTATVNPAKGNLWAASSYFVKAAELNAGESGWLGRLWLALALLGSVACLVQRTGRAALLLWTPLPFYALSLAYGGVPIFLPAWWPFSYYNVRYGLELLPAFAVFVPLGIDWLVQSATRIPRFEAYGKRWRVAAPLLGVAVLAAVSYGAIWRADPICYREAAINARGRVELEKQLAGWLKSLPADSTLLMYLGEHSGALQDAGIPLRRVIQEGNHRVWRQPVDPNGLWERALGNPLQYADYAIGFEHDPVWDAAKADRLVEVVEIHTTGQRRAAIFLARAAGRRPEPAR